jgi:hypothetical protein
MAGLALAVAAVGGGCDSTSLTDLPGTAKVLEVMINVPNSSSGSPYSTPVNCTQLNDDGSCADPMVDGLSGYALTYGVQFQYDVCAFDANANQLGDCPKTAQGLAMTCAMSGDFKGHCVDPATMVTPLVQSAPPQGISLRLVVGTLLDGRTLEEFACACQGEDLTKLSAKNCPAGGAWSLDPNNCGACGGDADHQGKCLDTDNNGLPDVSSLLPGVATIQCGSLVTYMTAQGEGFYYPSGNQYQNSQLGLPGLGPAIELDPSVVLPTDTDCTVSISDSVKTKKGGSLEAAAIKFHTDVLGFTGSNSPADGDTDVAINVNNSDCTGMPASACDPTNSTVHVGGEVDLAFNAPIDQLSANATGVITLVSSKSGPVDLDVEADDTGAVALIFADNLDVSANYTVTIKKTVKDTFGKTLPGDLKLKFTTAAK